jgi:hypothetical protein
MQISGVIDVFKRSSGPSRIRGAVCAMARRECPFLNRPDHPLARSRATAVGRTLPIAEGPTNGRFRRMGAVDPPFRRQTGVAPIEPAGNGRSTIYT